MLQTIQADFRAIRKNDPAARNWLEVLVCYTTFYAILIHRLTHFLWRIKLPIIPRILSQINRFLTGVEIHPGASIGKGLFIDNGMGVVIGETAKIGENCIIFHNVTLGGTKSVHGRRHPKLGDNCLVGTGTSLLGPILIGSNVKIGAATTVINRNIPDNCSVVGVPGHIVHYKGIRTHIPLPSMEYETLEKMHEYMNVMLSQEEGMAHPPSNEAE
ncbi:serine O-acetyltransferase [bacterium]|nr:serine O-acetyltransferase [bacterium]